MNLKIQRQFLFKILFGLERVQLGSVDACVSACVCGARRTHTDGVHAQRFQT